MDLAEFYKHLDWEKDKDEVRVNGKKVEIQPDPLGEKLKGVGPVIKKQSNQSYT